MFHSTSSIARQGRAVGMDHQGQDAWKSFFQCKKFEKVCLGIIRNLSRLNVLQLICYNIYRLFSRNGHYISRSFNKKLLMWLWMAVVLILGSIGQVAYSYRFTVVHIGPTGLP